MRYDRELFQKHKMLHHLGIKVNVAKLFDGLDFNDPEGHTKCVLRGYKAEIIAGEQEFESGETFSTYGEAFREAIETAVAFVEEGYI